ncbi:MAG: CopG family transcriptional regulator [Armatimonadetes bacterium]|nr:CopG family transcriptional regulator [Armatimonadota bacterium]
MRKTRVVGFSVPPEIARAMEKTARAEHKTKSELLRDMWEAYQILREEREFTRLQRSARRRVAALGYEIRTEEDVERLLARD